MKHLIFIFCVFLGVELNAQTICVKVIPEKVDSTIERICIVPEVVQQICVPATYTYEYKRILVRKGYWKGDTARKCVVWQEPIYTTIQKQTILTSATVRTITTPAVYKDVVVYDVQRDARTVEGDCN